MVEWEDSFKADNNFDKPKTFVRGETVINSTVISTAKPEHKEYKPQLRVNPPSSHHADSSEKDSKARAEQKKKRAIDDLKEELKR